MKALEIKFQRGTSPLGPPPGSVPDNAAIMCIKQYKTCNSIATTAIIFLQPIGNLGIGISTSAAGIGIGIGTNITNNLFLPFEIVSEKIDHLCTIHLNILSCAQSLGVSIILLQSLISLRFLIHPTSGGRRCFKDFQKLFSNTSTFESF